MPSNREIVWADGLRGIASFLVVIHHCTWAFAPEYRFPANSREERPYIFQLPFLRILVIGGNFCVALFFFLSGFVCSIKTLRLARDGNKEAAKLVAGSSIVRRVVRLAVPATAATFVSWLFCQLGTYGLAQSAGGLWFNGTAAYTPGVIPAIVSFFRQCMKTWTVGSNAYDGNQWTMRPELLGSMFLYLTLIATSGFTTFWRRVTLLILATFSFANPDPPMTGVCFFTGALLADLSLVLENTTLPKTSMRAIWPFVLAIFALFLGSCPEEGPEKAVWSTGLYEVGIRLFPGYELKRVYCTMGAFLLILSILFSTTLRHLLSNRHLVFLGSISFSMYLLHAMLMRTILAWIMFGVLPQPSIFPNVAVDEIDAIVVRVVELNTPSTLMIVKGLVFATWMMLLICLSVVWRDRVDGFSVEFARSIEDIMSGRSENYVSRLELLLYRSTGTKEKGVIKEAKEVSTAIV